MENTTNTLIQAIPYSDLLRMPFVDFLQAFTKLHPVETQILLGRSDVSPESAGATRHSQSWAYRLFEPSMIVDHREFDRAALDCLCLYEALHGSRSAFPLSDHTWMRLHRWVTDRVVGDDDIHAWFWALLFNDLGKSHSLVQLHDTLREPSADHDRVLADILECAPQLLPTYSTLGTHYQVALVRGLKTGFNLGKAAQLECPDVSWNAVCDLSEFDADFHFGHSFFDFLGVTGAIDPVHALSSILNENNVGSYLDVIDSILVGIVERSNVAPRQYQRRRAVQSKQTDSSTGLVRAIGMSRIFDGAGGGRLANIWAKLPMQTRAILEQELEVTGRGNETAIEPHYGPAVIAACVKSEPVSGVAQALTSMAEVLFLARREIVPGLGGIAIANMRQLAERIATDGPTITDTAVPQYVRTRDGFRIDLTAAPTIDLSSFPCISANQWLRGRRAVFVGIGGGSDVLQATTAALESAATPVAVIFVRTAVTTFNDDVQRTIVNHNGEVARGVWRVHRRSTGSGRFLEYLPAAMIPTYLVFDYQDGSVGRAICCAVKDAGGADILVAVDTGGDALYSTIDAAESATKTTPEQDLRVLSSIARDSNMESISLELAVGIDSPPDAYDRLRAAGACVVDFAEQSASILERYRCWATAAKKQTGSKFLGKTPLAWTAALAGERGRCVLDIPLDRVLNKRNPWNPFVRLTAATTVGFTMSVDQHLLAIQLK